MGSIGSFFANQRSTPVPVNQNPHGPARDFRRASWLYQLQDVDPTKIAGSKADFAVIDWTVDGYTAWPRDLVESMKANSKTMLAYVSIGEAESYRPYWGKGPQPWLLGQNPEWKGNYAVRFEDPHWQCICLEMCRSAAASGFDGVYLDKVDVYEDRVMGSRGALLMIEFVSWLSHKLKVEKPGFLVFPQNADRLLGDADYRAAIDGAGREDLLYNADEEGARNEDEDVGRSIINLLTLVRENKPILAVEYTAPTLPASLLMKDLGAMRSRGLETLVPLVAGRALDKFPQ